MTNYQILLLCALLVGIVVFMYMVLPRIGDAQSKSGKWTRLILFTIVVGYLALDFYSKGKFGFLIIIALGSIAFIFALFGTGKRK
jgi:energy-converting hydrogenase Eha subunit A